MSCLPPFDRLSSGPGDGNSCVQHVDTVFAGERRNRFRPSVHEIPTVFGENDRHRIQRLYVIRDPVRHHDCRCCSGQTFDASQPLVHQLRTAGSLVFLSTFRTHWILRWQMSTRAGRRRALRCAAFHHGRHLDPTSTNQVLDLGLLPTIATILDLIVELDSPPLLRDFLHIWWNRFSSRSAFHSISAKLHRWCNRCTSLRPW